EDSPISEASIDSLFKKYSDASAGGATILVAHNGNVLLNKAYGIGVQSRYMPSTTVPQFAVGGIREAFNGLCSQLPDAPAPARGGGGGRAGAAPDSTGRAGGGGRAAAPSGTSFQNCVNRRVKNAVGMQKTNATAEGEINSNVDELYRLALG